MQWHYAMRQLLDLWSRKLDTVDYTGTQTEQWQ